MKILKTTLIILPLLTLLQGCSENSDERDKIQAQDVSEVIEKIGKLDGAALELSNESIRLMRKEQLEKFETEVTDFLTEASKPENNDTRDKRLANLKAIGSISDAILHITDKALTNLDKEQLTEVSSKKGKLETCHQELNKCRDVQNQRNLSKE